MSFRLVDQIFELGLPNLLSAITKDKEQRIDNVGFAAAVGPNNGGKTLEEEAQFMTMVYNLCACPT